MDRRRSEPPINAVFGAQQLVQRCRAHKLRNVLDYLPKEQRDQVKSVLRAAWELDAKAGLAPIRKLVEWLDRDYRSAATNLLEGLEECFTIHWLGVPPPSMSCLASAFISTENRFNNILDVTISGPWRQSSTTHNRPPGRLQRSIINSTAVRHFQLAGDSSIYATSCQDTAS